MQLLPTSVPRPLMPSEDAFLPSESSSSRGILTPTDPHAMPAFLHSGRRLECTSPVVFTSPTTVPKVTSSERSSRSQVMECQLRGHLPTTPPTPPPSHKKVPAQMQTPQQVRRPRRLPERERVSA